MNVVLGGGKAPRWLPPVIRPALVLGPPPMPRIMPPPPWPIPPRFWPILLNWTSAMPTTKTAMNVLMLRCDWYRLSRAPNSTLFLERCSYGTRASSGLAALYATSIFSSVMCIGPTPGRLMT